MLEIKLCSTCAAFKCSCPKPLKACADCDTYAPLSSLTTKSDGREVCPKCQGKIERRAESKRQLEFFGQDSLFN